MKSAYDSKVGRFKIARKALTHFTQETISDIFKHFFVVRAESLFAEDCIEYIAYSQLFRSVEDGERIPSYVIIYESGSVSVKEERP